MKAHGLLAQPAVLGGVGNVTDVSSFRAGGEEFCLERLELGKHYFAALIVESRCSAPLIFQNANHDESKNISWRRPCISLLVQSMVCEVMLYADFEFKFPLTERDQATATECVTNRVAAENDCKPFETSTFISSSGTCKPSIVIIAPAQGCGERADEDVFTVTIPVKGDGTVPVASCSLSTMGLTGNGAGTFTTAVLRFDTEVVARRSIVHVAVS
jgi:hypothetical protein